MGSTQLSSPGTGTERGALRTTGQPLHVLVFANGDLAPPVLPLPGHDLVIAADGGAGHALRLGLTPDVLVGDLDSVSAGEIERVEAAGGAVIRHPADKDETDLELALDHAAGAGAAHITCLGLVGGRWDMTIANLLLLASPRFDGIHLEVLTGLTRMHILRGGETIDVTGSTGTRVSVITLRGPAEGVTYEGLAWPLTDASLPFGSPRGVSNRMESATATISIRSGVVLIVVDED
jgi:thiamine pyrophosphokinase